MVLETKSHMQSHSYELSRVDESREIRLVVTMGEGDVYLMSGGLPLGVIEIP